MFQSDLAKLLSIFAIELRYAAADCLDPGLSRAFLALADVIDRATM